MKLSEILLVLIGSAGLLHGVSLAAYLSFFKKKQSVTNILLSLILTAMAFRIGKSVLLNFGNDLEPLFIFVGLAFLLLIGPFLKWYVRGMTTENFKISRNYLLELVPFLLIVISSLFISKSWYDTQSKEVIIVFGSTLIFIYLHLAFYIFLSWRILHQKKKAYTTRTLTKSQKAIFQWLQLVIIGFIIIWISYFLNIIEDAVPYITGPILYSVVIYYLSFKAYQLKVIDMDGTVFKENKDALLFEEITKYIVTEKQYLEPQISLSIVSKTIGQSTQKTSEVINQYATKNFNDFVNYYRIQEAKKLLIAENTKHHTISAIAFDAGFSSLSSFNSAFKKFEKQTPSAFRKAAEI